MPDYSVMALTQAFIADGTNNVTVHLSAVASEPLILTMTPASLGAITRRLTELHSGVQIRIGSTTGHFETHASDAQAVTADAPVGGGKVILSVRNSKGLIEAFALSIEQSSQLRIEMKKAEASARQQASQSRN